MKTNLLIKNIMIFVCLVGCKIIVNANGDPVISYSSVIKAGNPVPRQIADVQIVREDLYIQPVGLYTNVKVEYTLFNKSNQDYNNIDYGFPIDYKGTNKAGFTGDYISESLCEIGWSEQNIKNVAFFVDGNSLQSSASDTIVEVPKKVYNEEIDSVVFTDGISRRWYYTRFQIKSRKTVKLTVIYSLYNSYNTSLYSFASSVLNRYFPYRINFNYDFSPAKYWGDGTIKNFNVILDMNLLKPLSKDSKVIINGLSLQQQGNLMLYSSNNFNLRNAKPLQITFSNQGQLPSFYELSNKRIDESKFRIRVCGENKAYPAFNLTDMNLETVWVSDKDIVGDSIVITMKNPHYVSDILLFNGYQKSESLWEQNGKLTKIKVEVKWVDDRLNNYNNEQIISLEPAMQKYEWSELGIGIFRHPMIINLTHIYSLPLFVENDCKYDSRVRKIKITFLATKPGVKYKDICVSELVLLGI